MTLAAKLRRAPVRLATGAYILNSGVGKLNLGEEQAQSVHQVAVGGYPFLRKVPAATYAKVQAVAEIAIGGALLTPLVPAGLAGLALTGLSGSLLGLYWRTPGMHEEGSAKPTMRGAPLAKDVWMLGIGTSLIIDAALSESPLTGDQSRAEAKANTKALARSTRNAAVRAAVKARKQAKQLHK